MKLFRSLALLACIAAPASAQDLTFWSWRQEDRAAYQRFIADFQKANPGVTVKFEAFEPQNYQTILSTALAGGKGPDVMQVRAYGNLESIAKAGYLQKLDPAKTPELGNFPGSALKAEGVRGEDAVYAVPFASQTMLIVYNTELFAANGLKPPETWDELIEVCKALKAKGVTPFGNGTASGSAATPGSVTQTRTYATAGRYTVTFTVTDAAGASTRSTALTVRVG